MSWRISLLGEVRATCGMLEVTHFESSRVVALLARLALFPERIHPREELIELLWPEIDPVVGRNRLRNVLSVLRAQLEPPGTLAGSALVVTRLGVAFPRQNVETDVATWERLVRARKYSEAEVLWKGELLPGFYDDWILSERERLNALREACPAASIAPASPTFETFEKNPLVALPRYPTRFFGREEEQEQLSSLLQSERLVTLTGPGGVGKTRLSIETARKIAEAFLGGVAFVPLAQYGSAEDLLESIRRSLALPPNPNPLSALQQKASETPTLVVLDNFEQLVAEGGAEVVELLLSQVPMLTLLITSRRALRTPGEQEFPLAPLPEGDAVALFVNRAQAVRPRFALRPDNSDTIVSLCQRLEGLPLALELASSRIRGYTLAQMVSTLTDRFTLLTRHDSASRKETRHASLRATIEWSWQLLSPASQRLFARFSVFRGGATAQAVREVCDEPDAQTLLEGLVADSLVVTSEEAEMRFSLLETLREFAAERLSEHDRTETERRHADYFLALAALAANNSDDERLLEPLENEIENLSAALAVGWEYEQDNAFWSSLTGFLIIARARGHLRRATLWAERVFAHYATITDPERRLSTLHVAAHCCLDLGKLNEVQQHSEIMLAEAQALELPHWRVNALITQGYVANLRGELELSRQIQNIALAEARTMNQPALLNNALFYTGRATFSLALSLLAMEPERAQTLFGETETLVREALLLLEAPSGRRAVLLLLLSISLQWQGRPQEFYTTLKTAQETALKHKIFDVLMFAFWNESLAESFAGSKERAALCYGAFRRLREQIGYVTLETVHLEPDLQISLRTALGEEGYTDQLALAHQIPLETLIS